MAQAFVRAHLGADKPLFNWEGFKAQDDSSYHTYKSYPAVRPNTDSQETRGVMYQQMYDPAQVYTHTHTLTHMHVHTYTHTHTYTHSHIHIYINIIYCIFILMHLLMTPCAAKGFNRFFFPNPLQRTCSRLSVSSGGSCTILIER